MRVTGTHSDRQALRVVLVEDDEVLAELLGDFLAAHPRFTRPRVYAHAGAALPGIREFAPHAVLVDLRLAGSSGLDCIRRIREEGLRTHVLAFTSSNDEEAILGALKAGAEGYLLKQQSMDFVAQSLLDVCAGQPVISEDALRKIIGSFHRPSGEQTVSLLSPAERAIMDLTVDGLDCKHIARQLGISVHTVYIHNKNIIRKLGVTNRHAAAALWREQRPGGAGPTPGL
jgi:two-component system nitrate/nitrite response regulator NarL